MHAYLCAHVCVQVEERTAELLEKNHQLQASHFPFSHWRVTYCIVARHFVRFIPVILYATLHVLISENPYNSLIKFARAASS
jgi:hypothetical protein